MMRLHGLTGTLSAMVGFLAVGQLFADGTTVTPAAPASMESVTSAIRVHNDAEGVEMLREFRDFLSLPNISANHDDMLANAAWIERYLAPRGFTSETVTAGRAPYIIAERTIGPDAPTVLIYAHFDGQPVVPGNWSTPPFEPALKSGDTVLDWDDALAGRLDPEWRIYARSAGDDKAPVIALMHALDALDNAGVPVAVNVRLFLDGEEEVGSPTLESILDRHAGKLKADIMLFCDGPMHQTRRRQLVFGVRGSAGMDITTYGPARPLHSGHYGNWAPHPTDKLIRLLTTLKDEDGRVTVAGFFDDVRPASDAERAAVATLPRIDEGLASELALAQVHGDGEPLEALMMKPALIITGIDGGGVGSQARNIIVPSATASLNLRLVPDQQPDRLRDALLRHFGKQGFHVVDREPSLAERRTHDKLLRVHWRGGYPAFRSAIDGATTRQLVDLLNELDGEPPLLVPTMGGSLPIYLFERALPGMPIVILPVANHDNNQHGHDENLRLANLFDAVAVYAAVLAEFRPDRLPVP